MSASERNADIAKSMVIPDLRVHVLVPALQFWQASWSEARNAISRRRLRRWVSHEVSDLACGHPWDAWMFVVCPTGKSVTACAGERAFRNLKNRKMLCAQNRISPADSA
jgi:hypothetical protein